METDLLPEKYRTEMAKSYYQVPPLNRSLIRKVMIQELGDTPEQVFKTFDSQAFAAASLGQVHRAVSQAGEKLAVKVQYPGIDATINSDIQLVKQLVRPMKGYHDIVAVLEEIEERMLEETNYVLEADNMLWFATHLKMKRVVIPQVYSKQSSSRVLCMQHLSGLHLTDWLKTKPTQAQRDKAAQMIYDTYVRSVFELHRFHADPNVGNYLFLADGSIGLLDFGCVKTLTPSFSQQYSNLFQAVGTGDYEKMFDIYREIGVLKVDNDDISQVYYEDVLIPFFQWFSSPYQHEYFDFSVHKDFSSQGLKLAEAMHKHQGHKHGYVEVNKDFVYTDRTLYGLYKMFEIMGAKVRMQNQWTCG